MEQFSRNNLSPSIKSLINTLDDYGHLRASGISEASALRVVLGEEAEQVIKDIDFINHVDNGFFCRLEETA